MYRHRFNFIVLTSFFLGLMALTSPPVQAYQGLVPLGELIDQSDHILIGVVTDVAEGGTPGQQIAAIGVEEVFLGPELRQLTLMGSTTDPMRPEFHEGTRILAFLRATRQTGNLEPVAGENGIIAVGDTAVAVTRDIVTTALDLGASIRLRDVQYGFRTKNPPPPRVLVGSLLEELSLWVTPAEAPLVQQMACDTRGSFYPAAQLWAIYRVGALELAKARRCLERFVKDEITDYGTLVAAIEALGDLGNPKSVLVLQSLLPETQPLPAMDDGDDGAVREDVRPSTGSGFPTYSTWSLDAGNEGDIFLLGDVDKDGDADLVYGRPLSATQMKWYVRRSSGTAFGSYETWRNDAGQFGDQFYLADVKGDGDADLVYGRTLSDWQVRWYVRGAFSSGPGWPPYGFGSVAVWRNDAGDAGDLFRLGDGNGDGRNDLFYGRPTGVASLTATPNLDTIRWYGRLSLGSSFGNYTTWSTDTGNAGDIFP